jgi:hypothetical protein
MQSINTLGSKSQNPQVSNNLRINQLRDKLRGSQTTEETKELLTFFIEGTDEGAVKNWLLEFQRIFEALGLEPVGGGL